MKLKTNPNKDSTKKENFRTGILIQLEIDICQHRCINLNEILSKRIQ